MILVNNLCRMENDMEEMEELCEEEENNYQTVDCLQVCDTEV